MKPIDWPRYMLAKRLATGVTAYFWSPHARDFRAGCPVRREALGTDYGDAIRRAALLNTHLDAWRSGSRVPVGAGGARRPGTLAWLFGEYLKSLAFERVSERSRPEYRRALRRIEDLTTKLATSVGELPVASISPLAVDKIYERLREGPRGRRLRQANLSVDIARRAWSVVHRAHPRIVPADNPWRGVMRDTTRQTKLAATRVEAYALASTLEQLGEPGLGAAALIAFELLQRPENILAGGLTWGDYRPPDHPKHVRVRHCKTGVHFWLPMEDDVGLLYPELEAFLSRLPRLGLPVVLTNGTRGPARPYAPVYAQRRVREARRIAGLENHVTLDACRHGGMTELGDAELTEQGVMTLSGHKTPQAARLYVKRTDRQRLSAARQRRRWVENGTKEQQKSE